VSGNLTLSAPYRDSRWNTEVRTEYCPTGQYQEQEVHLWTGKIRNLSIYDEPHKWKAPCVNEPDHVAEPMGDSIWCYSKQIVINDEGRGQQVRKRSKRRGGRRVDYRPAEHRQRGPLFGQVGEGQYYGPQPTGVIAWEVSSMLDLD